MRNLWRFLAAIIIVISGVVAVAYSGLYDVSASTPHGGIAQWLLSTTSRSAIKRRSGSIEVPDLRAERLVQAGANDYDAMCAVCHGAPGRNPTAMAQGLNPPAPDLAESAQQMTAAELFWVTKNGIKMTGMPAWSATHDDTSLWPVVAFVTRLPGLEAEEFEEYLAAGSSLGHHSGNDEHNGHDHGDAGDIDGAAPEGHVHEVTSDNDHANARSDDHDDHHHEH